MTPKRFLGFEESPPVGPNTICTLFFLLNPSAGTLQRYGVTHGRGNSRQKGTDGIPEEYPGGRGETVIRVPM